MPATTRTTINYRFRRQGRPPGFFCAWAIDRPGFLKRKGPNDIAVISRDYIFNSVSSRGFRQDNNVGRECLKQSYENMTLINGGGMFEN